MSDLIKIQNEALIVEISTFGAELQSINSKDGREWLWNGDAAWWGGRAPLLFPIVGGSLNDTVSINGNDYSLQRHGFARKSEFKLVEQTETSCVFELAWSDATYAVYPFKFILRASYILDGAKLTNSVEVINQDGQDMPFGFGFHPAFKWPLPGASIEDLHFIELANGAEPAMMRLNETALFSEELLPSPFKDGKVQLDHSQYEDDAMVFPEGAGARLSYGTEAGAKLHFEFKNLPNLALWQKPGAPYICIEPWHGMAGVDGKGTEIMARPSTYVLEAGQSQSFEYCVQIIDDKN